MNATNKTVNCLKGILMTATPMIGKPVADAIITKVVADVAYLKKHYGVVPQLRVIQVGRDASSEVYLQNKIKSFAKVGIEVQPHTFESSVSVEEVEDLVSTLSEDNSVHGIMIGLPLPTHIENAVGDHRGKFDIFDRIHQFKDVDGVSRHSTAELYRGQIERLTFLPSTALAVSRMLRFYGVETTGKRIVVVGRNDITGKPIHHMLGGRMGNATVSWCHRFTPKQTHDDLTRGADIVITCVGSSRYQLKAEALCSGSTVIDVGTRVDENGNLIGDVDFDDVRRVAAFLTPVPRGVGPVTVACLMENVVRAAKFCIGEDVRGYQL
jgi:5,10-methylene-tetrahydrofolate dehydrogenase/methenyl tetrahydrofolate cyclohydrolase